MRPAGLWRSGCNVEISPPNLVGRETHDKQRCEYARPAPRGDAAGRHCFWADRGDELCTRSSDEAGWGECSSPNPRGERNRERHYCADDSCGFSMEIGSVGEGELPGDSWDTARERVVRIREGGLHRGLRSEAGARG